MTTKDCTVPDNGGRKMAECMQERATESEGLRNKHKGCTHMHTSLRGGLGNRNERDQQKGHREEEKGRKTELEGRKERRVTRPVLLGHPEAQEGM